MTASPTFVGDATTVLRLGAFTLLTDPDFVLGVLVTMDGRQGADVVELVRPGAVVPVHHDDCSVFTSPLGDFVAELARRGEHGRLRTVARGGTVDLLPTPTEGPA